MSFYRTTWFTNQYLGAYVEMIRVWSFLSHDRQLCPLHPLVSSSWTETRMTLPLLPPPSSLGASTWRLLSSFLAVIPAWCVWDIKETSSQLLPRHNFRLNFESIISDNFSSVIHIYSFIHCKSKVGETLPHMILICTMCTTKMLQKLFAFRKKSWFLGKRLTMSPAEAAKLDSCNAHKHQKLDATTFCILSILFNFHHMKITLRNHCRGLSWGYYQLPAYTLLIVVERIDEDLVLFMSWVKLKIIVSFLMLTCRTSLTG